MPSRIPPDGPRTVLRSPSPKRGRAESRRAARVPVRPRAQRLLLHVRAIRVPSGLRGDTLPRRDAPGFPTKPRADLPKRPRGRAGAFHRPGGGAGCSRPWGCRGERRSRAVREILREGSDDLGAALPRRCFSGLGSTSSLAFAVDRGPHRGSRSARARFGPEPRRDGKSGFPSQRLLRNGTGVPTCPSDDARMGATTFGSSAGPKGPVALRPSLAAGLPLSCHRLERGNHTWEFAMGKSTLEKGRSGCAGFP